MHLYAGRETTAADSRGRYRLSIYENEIARLLDQVAAYRASGDIEDALGEDLRLTLRHAEMYLDNRRVDGACLELERVLNMIGAEIGTEISRAAAGDLAAEATALSADLAR